MYNCTVPVPIVCTANSNDISYQIWYRTVPGLESTVVSLSSFMNSISLSVFVRKEKKENTIETHFHEITYTVTFEKTPAINTTIIFHVWTFYDE